MIKSSSREEILSQVQTFRDDAAVYFVQWKQCHEKLKTALRDKKFGVASHCREVVSCGDTFFLQIVYFCLRCVIIREPLKMLFENVLGVENSLIFKLLEFRNFL